MSAGGPYDLTLIQGGVYRRSFRFLANGVARNLDDCTVVAQIRKKEDPNSALLLDLAPYLSWAGDTCTLVIPRAATAALRVNDFKGETAAWDLWVLDADGDPGEGPMLAGSVTLDPSATQLAVPVVTP